MQRFEWVVLLLLGFTFLIAIAWRLGLRIGL